MEAQIKKAVCDYLDLKGIAYLRLNSGVFFVAAKGGRKYKVTGCPNGTADILILAPSTPIFMEFKKKGGKQSKDQLDFEAMVTKLGYTYVVIDNVDDGVALANSIKKVGDDKPASTLLRRKSRVRP